MAPVPEEAFEPAGEQAAEMGAESVLAAEAPASTAEASSVEEPAGAGEVSGCAEGVTKARVSVSEKGVVQMECQQEQESLLRTASLARVPVPQGAAEVSTGARLLKPLPPLRRGRGCWPRAQCWGSWQGEGSRRRREDG